MIILLLRSHCLNSACAMCTAARNENLSIDSDSFTVEASYFDDLTVKYDAIDCIEDREGNVDGTRTFGVGNFRLLLGTFENAEFGTYTRYTYYLSLIHICGNSGLPASFSQGWD